VLRAGITKERFGKDLVRLEAYRKAGEAMGRAMYLFAERTRELVNENEILAALASEQAAQAAIARAASS
jgi:hypothetical protein